MALSALARRERRLEAARGYLALEMPDHAVRELNAVDTPEECAFEVNQLRGEALRLNKQHDEALRVYSRALAENPQDVSVMLGMAWCYKRTDQLDKAISAMENAYQAASDEPIVLYNLACYFALAGDKNQALSWLGRSLRMDASLRKLIPDEPDFNRLRDDRDFQLIAGLIHDV